MNTFSSMRGASVLQIQRANRVKGPLQATGWLALIPRQRGNKVYRNRAPPKPMVA